MISAMRTLAILIAVLASSIPSVSAQTARSARDASLVDDPPPQQAASPSSITSVEPGRIARSAIGQAGDRQALKEVLGDPGRRINSRINTRISSRLRNRIDRNYQIPSNGTAAIEAAADSIRVGQR